MIHFLSKLAYHWYTKPPCLGFCHSQCLWMVRQSAASCCSMILMILGCHLWWNRHCPTQEMTPELALSTIWLAAQHNRSMHYHMHSVVGEFSRKGLGNSDFWKYQCCVYYFIGSFVCKILSTDIPLKVVFAKYLRFIKPYHPTVKSAVVNGTRKHFDVTNMYKLFCHRKCTAAAAYNLSVHKLQRIMLHRKYVGNFCQAITP